MAPPSAAKDPPRAFNMKALSSSCMVGAPQSPTSMRGSLGVQQGEAVRVGLRGTSRSSFDEASSLLRNLGVQIGDAVMVGLNGMSVLDPLVLDPSPLRVEERSMKSIMQVASPNRSEPMSLGTD